MAVTQQAVAGMRQLRDNRDENAAPTGLDSLELVSVMTITLGAAAVAACNLTNATFTRDSGLGVRDSGATKSRAPSHGRSLFPFREASEPVILSAAGAKDLLFVSAAPQQVLRSRACRRPPSVRGRPPAGPSLARVPRARSG